MNDKMPTEPLALAYWDSGVLLTLGALVPVLWILMNSRTRALQIAFSALNDKFEILRNTDHVRLNDFMRTQADVQDHGREISATIARQQDVIARLDRMESQLGAHIRADRPR